MREERPSSVARRPSSATGAGEVTGARDAIRSRTTDNRPRSGSILRLLDRLALAGMALGTCLMLQPWLPSCFRAGFACLLASTLLQIVTSHLVSPRPSAPDPS